MAFAPASARPERRSAFSGPGAPSGSARSGVSARKKPWVAMCRIDGERSALTVASSTSGPVNGWTPSRAATRSPSRAVPGSGSKRGETT